MSSNSKYVYFILNGRITQNQIIARFSVNISYVKGSYYGYEDFLMKRKRIGVCKAEVDDTTILSVNNTFFQEALSICQIAKKEVHDLVYIRQNYIN